MQRQQFGFMARHVTKSFVAGVHLVSWPCSPRRAHSLPWLWQSNLENNRYNAILFPSSLDQWTCLYRFTSKSTSHTGHQLIWQSQVSCNKSGMTQQLKSLRLCSEDQKRLPSVHYRVTRLTISNCDRIKIDYDSFLSNNLCELNVLLLLISAWSGQIEYLYKWIVFMMISGDMGSLYGDEWHGRLMFCALRGGNSSSKWFLFTSILRPTSSQTWERAGELMAIKSFIPKETLKGRDAPSYFHAICENEALNPKVAFYTK